MPKNTNACPLYKKCGGCQLQNMPYSEQLSFKQARVIKLLGSFCHVDEIIGMDKPYNYRNKVQAAFSTDRRGNIISGVYQSSSHKVVAVEKCMLEDEKADEIIGTVRKLLKSFKLKAYNEDTRQGFLRHVLVKRGFKSGQIMVVLVTGTPEFPKKRSFVNALLSRHPEITTVVWNYNPKKTSLVLGEREEILFGDGKIEEQLGKYTFRISPKAFYQINPVQTEILYNKAIEFADSPWHGESTVRGIGFISSRNTLDTFHTGFLILDKGKKPVLRDASYKFKKVLDHELLEYLNSWLGTGKCPGIILFEFL